jgi:hypothetical protein
MQVYVKWTQIFSQHVKQGRSNLFLESNYAFIDLALEMSIKTPIKTPIAFKKYNCMSDKV